MGKTYKINMGNTARAIARERIGQPRARTVEVPAKFRKLKHKRKFEPEENA